MSDLDGSESSEPELTTNEDVAALVAACQPGKLGRFTVNGREVDVQQGPAGYNIRIDNREVFVLGQNGPYNLATGVTTDLDRALVLELTAQIQSRE